MTHELVYQFHLTSFVFIDPNFAYSFWYYIYLVQKLINNEIQPAVVP